MAELPPPPEGILLAHFIVSDDVERSRRFYTEVGLVIRSLAVEYAHRGVRVNAGIAGESPAVPTRRCR
jgi:hypothetical protein